MKVLSIRLPYWMIEEIDKLVETGIFIDRSEFIRYAIRLGLREMRERYKDVLDDSLKKMREYAKKDIL